MIELLLLLYLFFWKLIFKRFKMDGLLPVIKKLLKCCTRLHSRTLLRASHVWKYCLLKRTMCVFSWHFQVLMHDSWSSKNALFQFDINLASFITRLWLAWWILYKSFQFMTDRNQFEFRSRKKFFASESLSISFLLKMLFEKFAVRKLRDMKIYMKQICMSRFFSFWITFTTQ